MFVNHFHVPLQSGCDETLKRMNRKYNINEFMERCKMLKQNFKDCNLTTDVIVGFPGESDEDFKITCENIKKIGFTKIHVFPFSSREGTVAARLPNQINGNVKKKRVNELIKLSKQMGKEYYCKFINEEIEVLFETYNNESNELSGYTSNYIKVNCTSSKNLVNQMVNVRLTELIEKDNDYEMKGEIGDELF